MCEILCHNLIYYRAEHVNPEDSGFRHPIFDHTRDFINPENSVNNPEIEITEACLRITFDQGILLQ